MDGKRLMPWRPELREQFRGFRAFFMLTVSCILLTGCLHRRDLQPYAGQWALRTSGKNMAVLSTKLRRGKLVGTLVLPKHFREGSTGQFSEIGTPIVTQRVVGRWKNGSAEFVFGRKPYRSWVSVPRPRDGLMLLDWFHGYVPVWKLNKAPREPKIMVATDWPARQSGH
jgi:hypothetical protein